MVCVYLSILQMSQRFSCRKAPTIDLTSSLVSKRTRQASVAFDRRRFKTLLDFQSYNSHFKNSPTVVERIVKFDIIGSTFILIIFVDKGEISLGCLMNWLRS